MTTLTITNIINNNNCYNNIINNNINNNNSINNNNHNNINNNNIIIKKLNIIPNEENLFFKVFHNIIILKEIYKNVRILEENDKCKVNSLKEFYNHPKREYISNIIFEDGFNEKIPRLLFKSSIIKSITFGNQFNQKIKQSRFSNSIKELVFGFSFNKPLKKNSIPSSITSLEFNYMFNQELIPNQSIPNSVKILKLGYSFNKIIQQNSIPLSVTSLEFGHSFNSVLSKDLLPKCLKSLSLGACWDHPLNDIHDNSILPDSLTSLKLCSFNHPIQCDKTKKSFLPTSLKKLIFVSKFNQPLIIGSLPCSLEYLDLGFHYSQIIERGVLSSGIKYLNLGNSYYWAIEKMGILPNQLEFIKFPACSFQKIVPHVFPRTLHTVSVGYYFKYLDSIPNWVKVVECSKTMQNIPKSINTIRFRDLDFSLSSISSIPDHISNLETGDIFNIPMNSAIPKTILSLSLGESFNQPINISNSNIKHLQFKCINYSHHLTKDMLPSNLQTITLNKNYKKKYFNNIPKSIKIITI